MTTPVTNNHFKLRVFKLVSSYLASLKRDGRESTSTATSSRAEPILPPLTPEDTSLFPSAAVNTYTAYISPWIDLCSLDPIIASISRQVLNLEINYANFCGVRSVVIAGPSCDASKDGGNQGLIQYARAVQEALAIGNCLTFLIHLPMYREPVADGQSETLSSIKSQPSGETERQEIDLFSSWDSWHSIRTVCRYSPRLFIGEWNDPDQRVT